MLNNNSDEAVLGASTADNSLYILTGPTGFTGPIELSGNGPGSPAAGLTDGTGWWTLYLPLASIPYTPANSGNWDAPAPTTLAAAIDRIAAALSASIGFAIP